MRADLVLIGLRGSGKTTLGRALAAQHGVDFLDLDDALARRLGTATAGDALRSLGEPHFRRAEAALVTEVVEADRQQPSRPAVIALGGGTPTASGVAEQLAEARKAGLVRIVLLDASIDALADRLAHDCIDRPPLTQLPPRDELVWLAARRLDDYRRLADACVDTTGMSIHDAISRLWSIWNAPRTAST